MSFEVFHRQRAAPVAPYVTIHKRGVIALNNAGWEALGKPDAVELLYDHEGNKMGLRAGDANAAHTYRFRGTGDGTSRTLSGTAFLQYYGIPFGEAQRFAAGIEDAGILVIDLSAPEPVPALRRAPAKDRRPKQYPKAPEVTKDP